MAKEDSIKEESEAEEERENNDQEEDEGRSTIVNRVNSPVSFDLNAPVSFDLNLCFNPSSETGAGDGRDVRVTRAVTPSKVFSCNYCRRKFYSSQALGGHQNAHKRERTIAKRAMRIGWLADKHVSLASLPLYGSSPFSSSSRPSIDIQAHHGSMMMMHPHHQPSILSHQQASPFHDLRGGPAKFGGQSGYFVGSVPAFGAVPFWPGSFRQLDDEAESSNNNNNNNNNNNINMATDPNDQDSSPDLSLKL